MSAATDPDLRVYHEDPVRRRGLVYARTRDALLRWALSVVGHDFEGGPAEPGGWVGWAGAGLYRLVPNPPTDLRDTTWYPSRLLKLETTMYAEARARAEAAAWTAYADALRRALDETWPVGTPARVAADAAATPRDPRERYEGGT